MLLLFLVSAWLRPIAGAPPPPDSLWQISPPLNYSDVLYAGWEQIPVQKEIQIYNGVAENRTYAHHPELFSIGSNVFLIYSSAPVDEDSMGQDVWISTSNDSGLTWSPGKSLMPAALLPNQTEAYNWKYWCDRGIAQRAWQALTFVHLSDGSLYAIGQSGSRWCPGRWTSAGRIAVEISLDGEPLQDPCWIEKNEWTDSERPDEAPAWSPWLYNNGLFAADGIHQMEEQTFAVWHDDADSPTGGYWQRHWGQIPSVEPKVGDKLIVAYSENKENIWVSIVDVSVLPQEEPIS
ncbi:hypothetical protein COL922a_011311 [Colletotrichum nupharicola]|nr:hypothetical protein COL922a_011311 [Colletotrichum nupharicola]